MSNPHNPNTHVIAHRFGYLRPTSLKEALAMLKEHPDARILAGGTNVLVDMKMQAKPADALPSKVMDITRIPGLAGIAEDGSGVRSGAATPIRALATSNLLWTSYTALAEAAAAFGSTQIADRKSTRLNSSHIRRSRMPSSA